MAVTLKLWCKPAKTAPLLQILGGAVFALRAEKLTRRFRFATGKQRRASAAAKAHHHPGLGQIAHRRLGNGSAAAKQNAGGVGNGDIPVQRFFALVSDIFHPPAVHQHAAVLQIIQIRPLGMQNGFELGGGNIGRFGFGFRHGCGHRGG